MKLSPINEILAWIFGIMILFGLILPALFSAPSTVSVCIGFAFIAIFIKLVVSRIQSLVRHFRK